jgi:hypothetical protein
LHASRLFLLLIFLIGFHGNLLAYPQVRHNRPTPKEIAQAIDQITKEEQSSEPHTQGVNTAFIIDREARVLTILHILGDSMEIAQDDVWRIPFKAYFDLNYLYRFLRSSDIPSSAWSPRVEGLKNLADLAIVDIENNADPNRLKARDMQIANQLDTIYSLIAHYYRGLGYRVPTPPAVAGCCTNKIRILTDPPHGNIRLLTYLRYRQCIVLKLEREQWPWLTINQENPSLAGRYHYFVTWSDGRTTEGDFQVGMGMFEPQVITFRPTR